MIGFNRATGGCWKWFLGLNLSLAVMVPEAGEFAFDFEDNPGDSSNRHRSTQEIWSESTVFAGLGNPGGFLSITGAVRNQSTAIVFPDIDDGAVVEAFVLSMDIRMGNGSNGPGYGFSVSFARPGDPLL